MAANVFVAVFQRSSSPEGAGKAAPGEKPPVWRRWRWWVAVSLAAGGLAGWAVAGGGLDRLRAWRAARFARQAEQAFVEGRLPLADLLLSSGLDIAPQNGGLRVARATLLIRTGRRAEAVREWEWLMRHADSHLLPAVVRSYALQLIAAGWWPELARLALAQLRDAGPQSGLWMLLVCESLRLSGERADPAATAAIPGSVERAIVAAYGLFGANDRAGARRALGEIDSTTRSYSNALLAARLWLLLQDERQARKAFLLVGRSLAADEIAIHELLFGSLPARVGVLTVQTLVRPGMTQAQLESGTTRLVVYGLARADPEAARELTHRLREHVQRLSPASLTAAWFYCGAAGDEAGERFWRQPLESSVGMTLPNLTVNRPNTSVLGILIGRVPLSFDLLYSVMAATAASAPRKPAAEPAAR